MTVEDAINKLLKYPLEAKIVVPSFGVGDMVPLDDFEILCENPDEGITFITINYQER